jgi:hypothetical protein
MTDERTSQTSGDGTEKDMRRRETHLREALQKKDAILEICVIDRFERVGNARSVPRMESDSVVTARRGAKSDFSRPSQSEPRSSERGSQTFSK